MYMDIKVSLGSNPTPIKKRLQSLKPVCDGLYPHEVLAIDFAPYCNTKDNNFVTYWKYEYGIDNKELREILNSLLERGYIELGTIADAMNKMTIPVLKEELNKRSLKVSGKKANLISRLIENVSEEELSKTFNKIPYKQTALGKQIIDKYPWIVYIHKNLRTEINIWDFAELMAKSPKADYHENIWIYLEKKCDELLKKNDYGFHRNTILTMSNLAYEEGDYKKSFDYLCRVTANDLTCTHNNFELDMFLICLQYDLYFSYEQNSSCKILKYFVEKYKNFMEIFDWSKDELRTNFVNNIACVNLPIWLFTPEQYGDILIAEMNEDTIKVAKIYKDAEKAFKKAHKETFREIKEIDKYNPDMNIEINIIHE